MTQPGSPDGYETWHDLHMPPPAPWPTRPAHLPPALPWWPAVGEGSGGGNAATAPDDTPYYLASTDLPDGRLGVIVDTGAWTNLWGLHFAQRLAHRAMQSQLQPTEQRLRSPLYVAGVGNGSQQANWELNIPIATTSREDVTSQHSMSAPAVEGAGAELPALLGLRSMQSNNGVIETGADHRRLTYPGPGGYEITWSPGTIHFDLESAPSGHLVLPVDNYAKLRPQSGGLPPKQLTLLAVGNGNQHDDVTDGREFGKLKAVLLASSARLPHRASPDAAGYDIYASMDVTIPAKSRRSVPTGIAALAPPGTYLRVGPRAGSAYKDIDVKEGVIDPGHRGEIMVTLTNRRPQAFDVVHGTYIAQLLLERIVTNADVVQVEQLPASSSSSGGFGYTGLVYLNMDSSSDGAGNASAVHEGEMQWEADANSNSLPVEPQPH